MKFKNADQPRILILRLSAVGDTILTLPVLCALRDRFPHAHISWAVHAGSASLLKGHSALDGLFIVPRGWHRQWSTFMSVRSWARQGKFDVVIEAQGLTKSAGIGWLSGARQRIGFVRGEFSGRELSPWFNNILVNPQQDHVVDQHLELLRPLEIVDPEVRFDLPRTDDDVIVIDKIKSRLEIDRGFVLIQPGAGWPSKLWPGERYAQVAKWLWEKHHLNSMILWSGQEEQSLAKQIVQDAGPGTLLAPSTSLPQLAELARRAKFFIGPDTGPLHLAAAVGTKCVGLYGPMSATRCGPYGQGHVILQNVCLQGGARSRRNASDESMRAISVDEVCAACDTLVSQRQLVAA